MADLPLYLFTPVLFMAIFYYMVNLWPPFYNFAVSVLITIMVCQAAVSLGIIISCASPNLSVALAVGPTVTIPLMNVGGFYQNIELVLPSSSCQAFLHFFIVR